jgi:hypothetical protein
MACRNLARVLCLSAAVLSAGCKGEAPPPRTDTGAEDAVRRYYEALLLQDWPAAHGCLDPDSRKRCGPERYAQLARRHRHGLGFAPDGVKVRSCEEHGDEALAHVVLTGQVGARQRRFRDATALRRSGSGWGVVLSPTFGG